MSESSSGDGGGSGGYLRPPALLDDTAPDPPRKPDVIFAPTPEQVVDKMLEVVRPRAGDVLYDLACGDARVFPSFSKIPADDELVLEGTLVVPEDVRGVVLFAHGSGSSRYSPRNRYVAGFLQSRGLATLLIDLLTAAEEDSERWTHHLRFDIDLLAGRLVAATAWLRQDERTQMLAIGCFGASTGAGASLVAAAEQPDRFAAVVSRGGRPDLAKDRLRDVRAPILLIVGGDDELVLGMNREAFGLLSCEKDLEVIAGATHLFEEPGALQKVAELASTWFARYLGSHERVWTEETGTWPT